MNEVNLIGMVHIPGVNDKEYAEYLQQLKPLTEQVMISIVDNRW